MGYKNVGDAVAISQASLCGRYSPFVVDDYLCHHS